MRANLHVIMSERPVMEGVLQKKSPFLFSFFSLSKSFRATLVALLIIVVTGGGVASAAEGAIPGDVLYPVKIEVNEKIRTAFAKTPVAKYRLAVELVERRLEEAERLEDRGQLNKKNREKVRESYDRETKKITENDIQLDMKKDRLIKLEIDKRIERTLKKHEKILKRLKKEEKREL